MRAKISAVKIQAVRDDLKTGELTQRQVAHRHKLHLSTINKINNGRLPSTDSGPIQVRRRSASRFARKAEHVLVLRKEGLSRPEISKKLKMPMWAVDKYLYRGPVSPVHKSNTNGIVHHKTKSHIQLGGDALFGKGIGVGIEMGSKVESVKADLRRWAAKLGVPPETIIEKFAGLF